MGPSPPGRPPINRLCAGSTPERSADGQEVFPNVVASLPRGRSSGGGHPVPRPPPRIFPGPGDRKDRDVPVSTGLRGDRFSPAGDLLLVVGVYRTGERLPGKQGTPEGSGGVAGKSQGEPRCVSGEPAPRGFAAILEDPGEAEGGRPRRRARRLPLVPGHLQRCGDRRGRGAGDGGRHPRRRSRTRPPDLSGPLGGHPPDGQPLRRGCDRRAQPRPGGRRGDGGKPLPPEIRFPDPGCGAGRPDPLLRVRREHAEGDPARDHRERGPPPRGALPEHPGGERGELPVRRGGPGRPLPSFHPVPAREAVRPLLALLALSFAGTAANVWLLSGIVPWFLLPDFSFLVIVYAGLFLSGPIGFLAALLPALFREISISGPPGTFLLASLAVYFAAREIGRRIFLRSEIFLLLIVAGLLAAETASVTFLRVLRAGPAFPDF